MNNDIQAVNRNNNVLTKIKLISSLSHYGIKKFRFNNIMLR